MLIRNGRVIDPASNTDRVADVLIVDGRVAAVAPNLSAPLLSPNAEVFDATGMIVAPGFIDMHVHLREPGFEHAENIESGNWNYCQEARESRKSGQAGPSRYGPKARSSHSR